RRRRPEIRQHPLARPTSCQPNIPFACYASEALQAQGAYTLLVKIRPLLLLECPPCKQKCELGASLGIDDATGRWTIDCDPRELFCQEGDSTDPKCIRIATFAAPGTKHENEMFFPHNVCTRQMIREKKCPKTLTAQIEYKPPKLGLEYVVQCDAGFTVPGILNGYPRSPNTIPCIPSLHQYAGLGKADLIDGRSMFEAEDIRPSNPTAAEQWKSYKWCTPQQLGKEDCLPPPLKDHEYFIADDFVDKDIFLPAPDPSKDAAASDKPKYQIVPTDCAKAEDADRMFCVERDISKVPVHARRPETLQYANDDLQLLHYGAISAIGVFLALLIVTVALWLNYSRFKMAREEEAGDRMEFGTFKVDSKFRSIAEGWKDGWMDPFSTSHDRVMRNYNRFIRRFDRFLIRCSYRKKISALDLQAADFGKAEAPDIEKLDLGLPVTNSAPAAESPGSTPVEASPTSATSNTSKPDKK
ncbi:unnamed protein product, partial [Mesorhabditis spiculigera]